MSSLRQPNKTDSLIGDSFCPTRRKQRRVGRGQAVTVCIAAIAEGRRIFCASDRMLTTGDIQFEPLTQKLTGLSNSVMIMAAGDAGIQAEIIPILQREILDKIEKTKQWPVIREVAYRYAEIHGEIKRRKAALSILLPLKIDHDSFISSQKSMDEKLVEQLARDLINFKIPKVSVIIAGLDAPNGLPHIYVVDVDNNVSADAWVENYDIVGFAAIGIGARHATSQFMLAGHSWAGPAPETLMLTYTAKKRSEVSPGVGGETDMFFIGPSLGQLGPLNPAILGKVHNEYTKLVRAEKSALDRAMGRVSEYVDQITEEAAAQAQAHPIAEGGEGALDAPETATIVPPTEKPEGK